MCTPPLSSAPTDFAPANIFLFAIVKPLTNNCVGDASSELLSVPRGRSEGIQINTSGFLVQSSSNATRTLLEARRVGLFPGDDIICGRGVLNSLLLVVVSVFMFLARALGAQEGRAVWAHDAPLSQHDTHTALTGHSTSLCALSFLPRPACTDWTGTGGVCGRSHAFPLFFFIQKKLKNESESNKHSVAHFAFFWPRKSAARSSRRVPSLNNVFAKHRQCTSPITTKGCLPHPPTTPRR